MDMFPDHKWPSVHSRHDGPLLRPGHEVPDAVGPARGALAPPAQRLPVVHGAKHVGHLVAEDGAGLGDLVIDQRSTLDSNYLHTSPPPPHLLVCDPDGLGDVADEGHPSVVRVRHHQHGGVGRAQQRRHGPPLPVTKREDQLLQSLEWKGN